MRILVTGGSGYVGSMLVSRLLRLGHEVVVFDADFFYRVWDKPEPGDNSYRHYMDIRNTPQFYSYCEGMDVVIHLACISNDPSFELDESLSRTINYEAFEPMVIAAKLARVKRFIYASSSSVYGISDSPDVREDHPLVPLTLYNKYKGMCEPLLFKHMTDDFICTTLRPSTVCGWSPRLRLDLSVNILTHLAIKKNKITVFGGAQKRPNLHIEDMVDAYIAVMNAPPELVQGQAFNVGAGNRTIMSLAEEVRTIMGQRYPDRPMPEIETSETLDTRSYQVNSDKIKDVLGFMPRRTIRHAVLDLCDAFDAGLVPNSLEDDRYYNVRQMRKIWTDIYKGAPPTAQDANAGVMSEIDLIRAGMRAGAELLEKMSTKAENQRATDKMPPKL